MEYRIGRVLAAMMESDKSFRPDSGKRPSRPLDAAVCRDVEDLCARN